MLATEAFIERATQLMERLPQPPLAVAEPLLREAADSDSPRGIVAVAHKPPLVLEHLPEAAGAYLFLDRIQDPGNLGALARVARAAGAVALVSSPGTVNWRHPRALRASAGALLDLPVLEELEAPALARALREWSLPEAPPHWSALVTGSAPSLYEASIGPACVLALGSEGSGLEPTVLELCEQCVTIPLASGTESLNVVTAAAVVLFELRRRSLAASP